ncbi:hypothetical protein BO83DRAFT_379048 [Aspergillus eucalypticola CBS 122712]|uniref:Uncharacterized protein n=1 Tax=Aspergillus eucalypticola (strain CBS 122712 / IBT 29274) TaxID=1448314 RepID=A0A317VG16_ASPEC|nr:uncharacterized protein BO83DRAFT_379048 [Aspergillus eucalypticola CBS 122712]PWY72057.1 hypothetical protein BO83DRAFT_379048 [Aspergillus eucalypticola CBS 122712]
MGRRRGASQPASQPTGPHPLSLPRFPGIYLLSSSCSSEFPGGKKKIRVMMYLTWWNNTLSK